MNTDVIGTEFGGVLKNLIAVAVGIVDGVGYGENTKASIITRGLAEMTDFAVAYGGRAETLAGLAGLGDLIATCESSLSRNNTAGRLLGQGYTFSEVVKQMSQTAEGLSSVAPILELALAKGVEMPIVSQVAEVLAGTLPPKDLAPHLTTDPMPPAVPQGSPVGFPAWLSWTHALNVLFMLMIIRTGILIRAGKRPDAFVTSKRPPKGGARPRRLSITVWLHNAFDIVWVINGVVYVVLLFVSGQWLRIVPTSWDVIPNAISAALQYASLNWPTENGWVHYNAPAAAGVLRDGVRGGAARDRHGIPHVRPLAGGSVGRGELDEPDLPGGVGARHPLPGDALLPAVHRRARHARVRDGGAAQPQPHVRQSRRGVDGPASSCSAAASW